MACFNAPTKPFSNNYMVLFVPNCFHFPSPCKAYGKRQNNEKQNVYHLHVFSPSHCKRSLNYTFPILSMQCTILIACSNIQCFFSNISNKLIFYSAHVFYYYFLSHSIMSEQNPHNTIFRSTSQDSTF